jgi:hypothetical protein
VERQFGGQVFHGSNRFYLVALGNVGRMSEPENDEPQEETDPDDEREGSEDGNPWAKTSSGDADDITDS